MKLASRSIRRDRQVREFEERDLGQDIAQSRSAVVVRSRKRQTPTSILLDPAIINKLKEKAGARGIGYQTMLKIIVHEHVDGKFQKLHAQAPNPSHASLYNPANVAFWSLL